jgi:hypothetical protein
VRGRETAPFSLENLNRVTQSKTAKRKLMKIFRCLHESGMNHQVSLIMQFIFSDARVKIDERMQFGDESNLASQTPINQSL